MRRSFLCLKAGRHCVTYLKNCFTYLSVLANKSAWEGACVQLFMMSLKRPG